MKEGRELIFTPDPDGKAPGEAHRLFGLVGLALFVGDPFVVRGNTQDKVVAIAETERAFKRYGKPQRAGLVVVGFDYMLPKDHPDGEPVPPITIPLDGDQFAAFKECVEQVCLKGATPIQGGPAIFGAEDALDVLDFVNAAKAPAE